MAWYSSGTVNVTNGVPNVTLSGGDALLNISPDDGFVGPDGRTYPILTIGGSGTFTLAGNYLGPTASAQDYAIIPVADFNQLRSLLISVNTLITEYQDVTVNAGIGLFEAGTASLPGVRANGHEGTGLVWNADGSLSISVDGSIVATFNVGGTDGDVPEAPIDGLHYARMDGGWVSFTPGGGGGSGTVTSVNVSGGDTGLTVTGGPITDSGTLTLVGFLNLANLEQGANGAFVVGRATNTGPVTRIVMSGSAIANTVVVRGSGGVVTVGTPTDAAHAVTLGHLETGTVTMSGKTLTAPVINGYTEGDATASGTAFSPSLAQDTMFHYTTTGNATVTMPTAVRGKSFVVVIQYGGAHRLKLGRCGHPVVWWRSAYAHIC